MELWVRSKSKNSLVKVSYVYYCGTSIESNGGFLGDYTTEERCLEIINEIQSLLVRGGTSDDEISALLGGTKAEFIVYEMPKE